ncbi:MAG: FlgD immunoglobulin-like domain containing protein [Candidatus Krumholzibacteriia bacterium]
MARKVFEYNKILWICIFLVYSCLLSPVRGTAGENSLLHLENGLEISLFTPDDVMAMTGRDQAGRLILRLPDGTVYQLVEDILDPQIVNKGDGAFHPANADWVIEALAQVDVAGAAVDMGVEVFVLPLPRSGILASSACGEKIFLSPGVCEIDRSLVAFTVTHELGHVFQRHFAPEESGGTWEGYLKLRGLEDDAAYSADAPRANRPAEIFAEDFRYLFGGSQSRYSGGIENQDLVSPDEVAGLEEFFVALVAPARIAYNARPGAAPFALSNYPNPFNPSTTIRVVFNGRAPASAGEIDVAVYRADGSLVRRIGGGAVSGDEFSVRWDGRDDRGNAAPSGVYFYAVRSSGFRAAGKMLLAR